MIKDPFNVSGKKTDTQKQTEEDSIRNQKIQGIKDPKIQESLYADRAMRDSELEKMKANHGEIEKKAIRDAIQKKSANKVDMQLRPKYTPRPTPKTPKQIESDIKKSVRATVGAQLDNNLKNKRTELNAKMDKKIDTALSRQAEPIKRDKKAEFSKNAEDITRPRSNSTSQSRGRSRSR